jgi:hypothetical protein
MKADDLVTLRSNMSGGSSARGVVREVRDGWALVDWSEAGGLVGIWDPIERLEQRSRHPAADPVAQSGAAGPELPRIVTRRPPDGAAEPPLPRCVRESDTTDADSLDECCHASGTRPLTPGGFPGLGGVRSNEESPCEQGLSGCRRRDLNL